ncbi:mCG145534, partial [Mus musculus]
RWSHQAESRSQDPVSSAPPSLASGPVFVMSLDVSLVSPSANHFTDSGIFEGRKLPSQPSHLKSVIMSSYRWQQRISLNSGLNACACTQCTVELPGAGLAFCQEQSSWRVGRMGQEPKKVVPFRFLNNK